MDNSARFPHLMKAEILKGLPKDFRKDFLNQCRVMRFTTPTLFLHQGELADGMYLIADGNVDVFYLGKEGQRAFLARAGVGSSIGEAEAISEQICAATCEAREDTTLLFCSRSQLLEAVKTSDFVKNLTRIFHGHLLHLNYFKLVDRLAPIDHRLCAYLLMFSERNSTIYDSQSYLAEVVGCSRQTINKELGLLRDKKWISIKKSMIEILDRQKLETFLKERNP